MKDLKQKIEVTLVQPVVTKLSARQWLIDEFRSHFMTVASLVLTFVSVDGYTLLSALYQGDMAVITKDAVLLLVYRSIIKTILTLIFPKLFPQMKVAQK